MRLANKIGLVTGAGSGIGRAIARRFAAEGVCLMLSDISETGLQRTAAMIAESGGHSIPVVGTCRRGRMQTTWFKQRWSNKNAWISW